MNYKKINLYLGWAVFLIASIVYLITIEDTVSLWDCGEYITAAYKLEVGHPPGAPLFMALGRIFSFFAAPENVAVWINRLSAISSSLTILFMFWSLTLLVKKMVLATKSELLKADKIAIFSSALIGSLVYTFSDSFWFSAVEGEVYAMSSLFTAVIFWAILKWDEEMREIQNGQLQPEHFSPDRWILLIMFMLGLAIGVHLLGILVVPAIAFVMYFRVAKKVDLKGIILVGILSIVVLGFIQKGVISGSIAMASAFEISFVNSIGLPFYSGTIIFFVLIVVGCVILIRYARKKGNRVLYASTMGLIMLLIGYGSFAIIVIRSNANTPLDENDPENLVTLRSYLERDQYGSAPILFGNHWNSKENQRELWDDQKPVHLRRFVVVKNDADIKAFKDEVRANDYAKTVSGSSVEEKYYVSNDGSSREKTLPTYAQTTFLPRMYWSQEPRRIEGYKNWSGYDAGDGNSMDIGSDGLRLPTFGENMTYLARYQINWMYWRYFMWNFAGRQNDIQGHGDALRGNWLTGIGFIDNTRLGNQDEFAPYFTSENPSNNKFYLLPLILGFIGLVFHFYRSPKDAFVVFLAFLFTGIAIVIYLNQKPFEPRERDYAFAGSFYFFALWIGIGVYALYDAFKSFGKKEFKWIGIIGGLGAILMFANAYTTALTWIVMLLIAAALIGLMVGLRKVLKSDSQGAIVVAAICAIVPVIMGVQGWDDHDRSLKTSAHDLALNYLNSCEKNGIIFTNGDNDTFPLWYMQEVEGKRTDVRVCNLSLMQTDWYTDQMKMKAYDSEPLPIKFTEDQILMHAGNTDHVLFSDLFDLFYVGANQDVIKKIIDLRVKANPEALKASVDVFNATAANLLEGATANDARVGAVLVKIKAAISAPLSNNIAEDVFKKFQSSMEVFSAAKGGMLTMSNEALQGLQNAIIAFEEPWNKTELKDAMEFVRDDANIVTFQGQREFRIFPSTGFNLKVNKTNALNSGIISKKQMDQCLDNLEFKFTSSGISREQVMMLDILANNDWKRPIYFSSPGGSDVSMSLLRGMNGRDGYIKQNGMAFELSPLNAEQGSINREKMYANLMSNYTFGAMSNPDVLTDYYARRHTSQYRSHYLRLAEDFVIQAFRGEQELERSKMLKEMSPDAQIPEPTYTMEQIKEFKKKASNLIHRSLEVMPANIVFDYGEPTENTDPRKDYNLNGRTFKAWSDGSLHEYVRILFMAGDKEGANKLGLEVARQLESIITYFDKSDVGIAASRMNTPDLYAAIESYFQMHIAAIDPEDGDPRGALAKRTEAKIKFLYDTMYPSMFNRLEALANENGESVRRGSSAGLYANMLFELKDYSEAMAVTYGLIDAPEAPMETPQAPVGNPGLPSPGLPIPQ